MGAEFPKLRLGLLLEDLLVTKYVAEFIRLCRASSQLEVLHIFVLSSDQFPRISPNLRGNKFYSWSSRVFFSVLTGIETLLLRKNARHFDHLKRFDLRAVFPKISISSYPEDVKRCAELELDLLIDLTTTDGLSRDVLNHTQLGMIAVYLSDDRVGRDGPAGFWEVYFRCDVTGFSIVHLDPKSDTKQVLLRGRVGTEFYYLLNQASVSEKSMYYLFKTAQRIATTGELGKPVSTFRSCHAPQATPRFHETIFYFIGLVHLASKKILEKMRGHRLQWNVGFLHSDWKQLVLSEASIIKNPPRHFLADPFVISRNGKHFCFVEDYDNATRRGKISAYELASDHATYIGIALEDNFHLSYPYLFHYRGTLYMCPETSANRDVRVYRCIEFPLGWRLEKVLMKDVSAVDTMLFEKSGKWWLLTNIDPAQWDDFSLELHVFSAKSPLEEQWIPHPGNPFFIDASRARNGGLIKENGRVYRVAQAKGFDLYGKEISINEIVELNDQSYVEKHARTIRPTAEQGFVGTHHLHCSGNVTVVDLAHDGRAR